MKAIADTNLLLGSFSPEAWTHLVLSLVLLAIVSAFLPVKYRPREKSSVESGDKRPKIDLDQELEESDAEKASISQD